MSAPVLRWLFIAQRTSEDNSCSFPNAARSSAIRSEERSAAPAQRMDVERGPLCPTLRAIPFPKVTELFCRLPSATLFYRPEAANLGDLMRLWVRARERITRASDFQGQLEARRIPHNARNFTLLCSLPPDKMIPGIKAVEKKR